MALVDVVIPTRNRVDLTAAAVHSVRSQTLPDWRLTIVDDGSTDGSGQRLADLFSGDPRITVLRRPHQGPERARDAGVQAGQAPWVALLDSDDLWLPTKLEEQIALIPTGADVVLCWYEWRRPDGSIRKVGRPSGSGTVSPLLTDNMSMPLIRRTLLADVGGLGHQPGLGPLPASEGIEFYIRLLTRAAVEVVPEVLVSCRDHPGLRESAGLTSAAAAEALDAVARHHVEGLRRWPREHASLTARVAARYVAAGRREVGYARFRDAARIAPVRYLPGLARDYGPFLLRDAATRAVREARPNQA